MTEEPIIGMCSCNSPIYEGIHSHCWCGGCAFVGACAEHLGPRDRWGGTTGRARPARRTTPSARPGWSCSGRRRFLPAGSAWPSTTPRAGGHRPRMSGGRRSAGRPARKCAGACERRAGHCRDWRGERHQCRNRHKWGEA